MTDPPILGVDIGGTFTDLVTIVDDHIRIYKLLSTKTDLAIAFLDGMDALRVSPDAVVAHGTTVATNVVLEHKGARTGLIATHGFRDALFIGGSPGLRSTASPSRPVGGVGGRKMEVSRRLSRRSPFSPLRLGDLV